MARKVKNVIQKHNMCAKFYCLVCGDRFEQNMVAAMLVEEEEVNETGEVSPYMVTRVVNYGDVCPNCLRGGVEYMQAAINERKRQLDELEELIQDVEHWVSVEQLKHAEREHEEELRSLYQLNRMTTTV